MFVLLFALALHVELSAGDESKHRVRRSGRWITQDFCHMGIRVEEDNWRKTY